MRDHTGRRRSIFVDGMDQYQPYRISITRDYADGGNTTTLYTCYQEGTIYDETGTSSGQQDIYIRKDVHTQTIGEGGKVVAETITATYTIGNWESAVAGSIADSAWKPINNTWADKN